MEILCGTDIIEIARIEKSINNLGDSFLKRIFTDTEINYCESRKNARFESYAARFAAKEAIIKTLNAGRDPHINWHEMEIGKDDSGRPYPVLSGHAAALASGLGITGLSLSLSHCREYATAVVCAIAAKS
ncbi:MAG: holo-ACP synthase [Eubacteriales bacterium]|jgi:holo-[acyl-carrier protein] synthase|nr:holo-ACP synthase [Eubacteriales bacterium]